jgi:hypothetical protein
LNSSSGCVIERQIVLLDEIIAGFYPVPDINANETGVTNNEQSTKQRFGQHEVVLDLLIVVQKALISQHKIQ